MIEIARIFLFVGSLSEWIGIQQLIIKQYIVYAFHVVKVVLDSVLASNKIY